MKFALSLAVLDVIALEWKRVILYPCENWLLMWNKSMRMCMKLKALALAKMNRESERVISVVDRSRFGHFPTSC